MALLKINNKIVKSISIGNEVQDLTIEGSKYTFSNDIIITQNEVEKYTKDHTTWKDATTIEFKDSDYTSMESYAGNYLLKVRGYNTWPVTVPTYMDPALVTFKENHTLDTSKGYIGFFNGDDQSAGIFARTKVSSRVAVKSGETWLLGSNSVPIKVTLPYTMIPNKVATIDSSDKIKGLEIKFSTNHNIIDGVETTPTVVFDSSVSDSLNGGTVDVIFSKVTVLNPARIITQDEVDAYIGANVAWSGISGNLDVTKWQSLHPGTKLYTADLHMLNGIEYTFTVQADDGYTINGGSTVDYKINVSSTSNWFIGTFSSQDQEDKFNAITTAVADQEFNNEYGLISISMPLVETIGDASFYNPLLTTLDIPKVKTIGNAAFLQSKLTILDLPEVETIGEGTFLNSPLTMINVPKATSVGQAAFRSIVNDPSTIVTINPSLIDTDDKKNNIFNIGNWDKVTFKSIIPNSFTGTFRTPDQEYKFMAITTEVADGEFQSENELISVTMPLVEIINGGAFFNSHLTSITIPLVKTIGKQAFKGSILTTLDIPLVETIGEKAFLQSPLTMINIPKATSIEDSVFLGIVNDSSTVVTIDPTLVDTDAKKDTIFGAGNWDKVTFKDPA